MIRILSFVLLMVAALPAVAQANRTAPLLEAMQMSGMLAIMREEGLAYSRTLETDMFPGKGGSRWQAMVDDIYQPEIMAQIVTDSMEAELPPGDVDALVAFFTAPLGQRIIGLELSARRAMLDDAVEEVTRETWRNLDPDSDPRQPLIRAFVEANDLIETNVVGALNSNYAFYLGLDEGNAFRGTLSEDDMLREVWDQEADIRDETEEWVYSYLTLAYQPLSDAELQTYIDLSKSPAGRALNAAMFKAFDALFTHISRRLGLTATVFMLSEDL